MLSNHSILGAAAHGWTAVRSSTKIFLGLLLALGALGAANPPLDLFKREGQKGSHRLWFRTGYAHWDSAAKGCSRQTPANPNARVSSPRTSPSSAKVPGTVPVGAAKGGFFGPSFTWPIIPLHVALLSDGRVLNYGTDENGVQGAAMIYDVWNPTLGTDIGTAHTILTNTTSTDIFCSAVSLLELAMR